MNVPRKVTNYTTKQETVIKDVTRIEMVPVTKTRTQVYFETVMKTVQQTEYRTQTVTSMVPRVVTTYKTETYTETVPVTNIRQVVEECGSYEMRMVPKIVPDRAVPIAAVTGVAAAAAFAWRRSGRLLRHDDRHGVRAGIRFPARRPLGPRNDLCPADQDSDGSCSADRRGLRDPDRDGPRDCQCPGARAAAADKPGIR